MKKLPSKTYKKTMSVRYRKSSSVNILAALKLIIFIFSPILCLLFMGYPMSILVFASNALVPKKLVTHRHDLFNPPYESIHKSAQKFVCFS
jgi:ABC-type uncharacterized transport system permease subunit